MKVLVTGGAGFVGSHIVNRFCDNGHDVQIYDNLGHTSSIDRIDTDVVIWPFSIEDGRSWVTMRRIGRNFDLVINSAAETHVDESFDRPKDFIRTNILGLHHLSRFCIDCDIPLIHLSTDEVIGTGEVLHEDSMTLPTNPYSFTKAAGESLLHSYGYSYGLNWKSVRLNNAYGLKQFPDKLITKFISLLLDNKKLPVHGDGSQLRNFLHVEDFVDAVELVMDVGHNRNIYNVTTDEEYSILQVTKMICEVMNKNFDEVVEYVEDRPSQDPSYNSVSTKLRSLGWVPKRTLEGQLPAIVEWTKNNREFFNE